MTEFGSPAADHMVSPAQTVRDTARLAAAAQALDEAGLSALPVVDGAHRLTGLLARSDLVRVGRLRGSRSEPRWWLPDITVAECMQSAVPVVGLTTPLRDCARRMLERGEPHLFVVVDRELEGVIGTLEMLRAVAGAPSALTLGEMSIDRALTIAATAPVSLAIERLAASAGRPLVVLSGDGPVGIFSRAELSVCLEADGEQATRRWADERVLVLPASTPAHRAAQRAIDARARHVITSHGARGYSVISSLSFASIVAGLPPAEAEKRAGAAPRPVLPIAVSDYPRDFAEGTPAVPAMDALQPARLDERGVSGERETPLASEPSDTPPRQHEEEEDAEGGAT